MWEAWPTRIPPVQPRTVVAFWPRDSRYFYTKHACFETMDGTRRYTRYMESEGITWCRDNPEALAALLVATALL